MSNIIQFLFWCILILFIWSWNQFKSFRLKLILYHSIIGSFWSFPNFILIFHILINRIMGRNWTVFIKSVVHKLLWILKVVWTHKHWLFDKSSISLIIFIMLSKFIKICLPNLVFSISFFTKFFYQLSFIFLQKIDKLLTLLMFLLIFNRWFLFFYIIFDILCGFVTVCFKK